MNPLQVAVLLLVSLIHQNAAAADSSEVTDPPKRLLNDFCQLTPQATEGPYFLKDVLQRSDIRDGKPGVPLNLTINLVDGKICTPLSGFRVDIWHCDGLGEYSGFSQSNKRFGGRWAGLWDGNRGPNRGWIAADSVNRFLAAWSDQLLESKPSSSPSSLFLRGYQSTDGRGIANFQTVVPGWYPGRSMHIHFEVRTPDDQLIHTGQFFFDEDLSQTIEKEEPYASNPHERAKNDRDGVFVESHGDQTTMEVDGDVSGMTTKYRIGVDATVTVPIDWKRD